jgi:hypothetical protein
MLFNEIMCSKWLNGQTVTERWTIQNADKRGRLLKHPPPQPEPSATRGPHQRLMSKTVSILIKGGHKRQRSCNRLYPLWISRKASLLNTNLCVGFSCNCCSAVPSALLTRVLLKVSALLTSPSSQRALQFSERAKSHWEPKPVNVGLHNRPFGHNLLDRERLLSWRRDQSLGGRQVTPFPSHNFR